MKGTYLSRAETRIGTLVLYHHPRTLDGVIAIITTTGEKTSHCELTLPDGTKVMANKLYLRRIPDESR